MTPLLSIAATPLVPGLSGDGRAALAGGIDGPGFDALLAAGTALAAPGKPLPGVPLILPDAPVARLLLPGEEAAAMPIGLAPAPTSSARTPVAPVTLGNDVVAPVAVPIAATSTVPVEPKDAAVTAIDDPLVTAPAIVLSVAPMSALRAGPVAIEDTATVAAPPPAEPPRSRPVDPVAAKPVARHRTPARDRATMAEAPSTADPDRPIAAEALPPADPAPSPPDLRPQGVPSERRPNDDAVAAAAQPVPVTLSPASHVTGPMPDPVAVGAPRAGMPEPREEAPAPVPIDVTAKPFREAVAPPAVARTAIVPPDEGTPARTTDPVGVGRREEPLSVQSAPTAVPIVRRGPRRGMREELPVTTAAATPPSADGIATRPTTRPASARADAPVAPDRAIAAVPVPDGAVSVRQREGDVAAVSAPPAMPSTVARSPAAPVAPLPFPSDAVDPAAVPGAAPVTPEAGLPSGSPLPQSPVVAADASAAPMTDALPPVASAWPVASDVRPAPLPAQPVALPAREAFAAAIFDAAARDRAERPLAEAVANPVGIAPPVAAASIGHADSRPIDMAAAHWPVAMIDRIERLRDEADASDTRIRLVPDALGSVEVAVRQVGDAVHVHFTAAEPETRQLLADAQGQLARAAEERGVRLGPTEVSSGPSGGGTGGGHRHPDAQGRPLPGRPRPAPSQAPEPSTGERLSTRIA